MKGYIMKKILLFASAVLAAFSIQAQTAVFVHEGVALNTGDKVLLTEMNDWKMMEWYPIIRNTSAQSVDLIVSVEVLENKYETDNLTMCDAQNCFPSTVTSLPVFTLAGNEESGHHFHAQFMAISAMSGATDSYAKARYTITNANNPDDATYVDVEFDLSKASVEGALVAADVKVFQNGENLVCRYNFDNNANRAIVVSNILGATVANVNFEGNNGEVVVNRLPKGVYVYTLVENGRNVKSHKIVVR